MQEEHRILDVTAPLTQVQIQHEQTSPYHKKDVSLNYGHAKRTVPNGKHGAY